MAVVRAVMKEISPDYICGAILVINGQRWRVLGIDPNGFVRTLQLLDCDCIASGNAAKPKQHGADPHAKNCAVYRGLRGVCPWTALQELIRQSLVTVE